VGSPIVVIVSSDIEWSIIREIFLNQECHNSPFGQYFENIEMEYKAIFFHGGWGKISAAASTQYVIDQWRPTLIINLGTCGGFRGFIEKGAIVLVERTIVYDIIEQMGSSDESTAHYMTEIDLSWLTGPFPQNVQRALMLSGDRDVLCEDIKILHQKYGAIVADWESGSIAWVASKNKVKTLILRGVSDLISLDGGEAYQGNIRVFKENAETILRALVTNLPEWISRLKL
jgi:adenosylhomocysteine nucleosidase